MDEPLQFTFTPRDYPAKPGVYLMKNAQARIIYVGKAIDLRKRLASYFRRPEALTPKTRALVRNIACIDILLARSEKEALLLEASLIKKHRPRYNIVLRDDKSHLLFRLDKAHAFPRLSLTRRAARDGAAYFGPFTSALAAKATYRLISRVFPLRKCGDRALGNRVRPCLYYHMKQCLGPCCLAVDPRQYAALVRRVELFLSGKAQDLVQELTRDMQAASDALAFEEAARLRDTLAAVRATIEGQAAVLPGGGDVDALALAETAAGLGLGLAVVRRGRLLDERGFFWPGLSLEEGAEAIEGFLVQYYEAGRSIPGRILLPFELDTDAAAQVLAERREGPVRLGRPATVHDRGLMELAQRVAGSAGPGDKVRDVGEALQSGLKLQAVPLRLEAVDASHLAGQGMRVGLVVFENGRRLAEDSRLYALEELSGKGDDYAALAAFAKRRVKSGPPWPDLMLVDGGKGQLAALKRGLAEAFQGGIPFELAAIAKGPSRRAGELGDRIFRPGRKNPLPLQPGSPELLFLQAARDAAHRFVIAGQRKSRSRSVRSAILGLPGIGPATARLLWERFETPDRMFRASEAELMAVPGIGRNRAKALREALRLLSPDAASEGRGRD